MKYVTRREVKARDLSHIYCFVFLMLLVLAISCSDKEKSEDKYPEIPKFPASSNDKYRIEKLPFKVGIALSQYIYQDQYQGVPEDNVVIQDRNYAVVKNLFLQGAVQHIDQSTGEIFTFNDSIAFKYAPPDFSEKRLETIQVDSEYFLAGERNDSIEFDRSLIIRDSLKAEELTVGASCLIYPYEHGYVILRYRDKDILVNGKGMSFHIDECVRSYKLAFQGKPLEPFDQVHLGYSFQGSNHIAFGIESNDLYYYKHNVGNDTIAFKNTSQAFKFYETENGRRFIVEGYHDLYEVKKNNTQ